MAKSEDTGPKLDGVKFTTDIFRLSFPQLHEPKQFMRKGKPEGKPKFQATMLFPVDHDRKRMNIEIRKAAAELWGPDKAKWPKTFRMPWRKGDEKSDYAGYEGMVYATCATIQKPGMITRNKKPVMADEIEEVFYPGCFARAVVVAKAYEMGRDAGVTLYLQHIQKTDEGERLGGGGDPTNEFDDDLGDEDLEDIEDGDDDAGF